MFRKLLCLWMAGGTAALSAGSDPSAPAAVATPAPTPSVITALTQQALRSGNESKLPSHLTDVLGLGTQLAGLPVRQLVLRVGQEIRAFNVSVARHTDLVIFSHDEPSRATAAYLFSPDGRLRKAVSYISGAESRVMPAAEAQQRFAAEIKYWSAVGQGAPAPH